MFKIMLVVSVVDYALQITFVVAPIIFMFEDIISND